MSDLTVHPLIQTDSVQVRDVHCAGTCRHRSPEECSTATHLVFPYRGAYRRHVGREQAFADANHVLFFNADEGYQVSHPVKGGDRSISVALPEELLSELAPTRLLQRTGALRFRTQHRRIDAGGQYLVALLRHGLANKSLDPSAAETVLFALVARSLGPRTSHAPEVTRAPARLVDRVKALLASDLARRWTLGEIAAEVGFSAVYLTQVFQQIEGMPLYRYHLRLRLARALDLIPGRDDVAALALELGFSSHSHFTLAFRQAYQCTPSVFKREVRRKSAHFSWRLADAPEHHRNAWSRRNHTMLELRPNCECCDADLPPDSRDARICSFECTFCANCASAVLANQCPNCGGELVPRPVRPAALLGKYPASSKRVVKKEGCVSSA